MDEHEKRISTLEGELAALKVIVNRLNGTERVDLPNSMARPRE